MTWSYNICLFTTQNGFGSDPIPFFLVVCMFGDISCKRVDKKHDLGNDGMELKCRAEELLQVV